MFYNWIPVSVSGDVTAQMVINDYISIYNKYGVREEISIQLWINMFLRYKVMNP